MISSSGPKPTRLNSRPLRESGLRLPAAALAFVLTAAAPPPGAESCTACHASGSGMGALAGMPATAIDAAMQGFRDHSRPATLMNRIAPGFTPEQTHAIATWFEQQK